MIRSQGSEDSSVTQPDEPKSIDEIFDAIYAAGVRVTELHNDGKSAGTITSDTLYKSKQDLKALLKEAAPHRGMVSDDADIYDEYDHDRELLRHELQENNINIGRNQAIDDYQRNINHLFNGKE